MGRPCYGAKYHSETGKYSIDPWVERSCPNYVSTDGDDIKPAKPRNPDVVIRIFGPKEVGHKCTDEDCVMETLDLDQEILQNLFNRIYGGRVAVESVDSTSEQMAMYPDVKRLIDNGAKVVVTINDEIKFIGSIPLQLIKLEIEKRGITRVPSGASRIHR
jgi:hypothetical protein